MKKYNLQEKLLETLEASPRPISAKDILAKLEQEFNKTSVYRQLQKLFLEGKVTKIESSKEALFESVAANHAHFECVKCGWVSCIHGLPAVTKDLANLPNIKVISTQVSLRGFCESCINF